MRRLFSGLAMLGVLVVIFGTMYAAVQQSQRSAANYPQIQLAEDAAYAANHGSSPITNLIGHVVINSSLAPFTTVYDKQGHPLISSGVLDGKAPVVPIGVLRAADGKPYSAVTWQPKAGVRIAAVTVATKYYYVLSGRSLSEVEKNESLTLKITAAGGLAAVVLVVAAGVIVVARRKDAYDFP